MSAPQPPLVRVPRTLVGVRPTWTRPATRGGGFAHLLARVVQPQTPAPPPGRTGTVRALAPATTTSSALAVAARLLENQWLVTVGIRGGRVLHAVEPTDAALAAVLAGEVLEDPLEPVHAVCGTSLALAAVPGALDSHSGPGGAPRCASCCAARGFPTGAGSPGSDETCAEALAVRLERLEACS